MAKGKKADGKQPEDPVTPSPEDGVRSQRNKLSARHERTLSAINQRPTRGDIPWRDIEALIVALGGEITNGRGSRRRVRLGARRAVFHEPHPERVTDKGAVADVKSFLTSAGVEL